MNKVNDLFILLLNLSQLHDKSLILQRYLESLNMLFTPVTFKFDGAEFEEGVKRYSIATQNSVYGYLIQVGKDNISEKDQVTLYNSIQMLAIILERLSFEKQLQSKRVKAESKAEKRLKKLKSVLKKLRSEQQEKELVLNNLDEQVSYLDSQMGIIWTNRRVIERHNLQNLNYKGQPCYRFYHKREAPCPNCPVIEALKTGKPFKGVHKSPENRYWQVNSTPVFGKTGEIIGIMNTSLEITELIESAEKLQESYTLMRLAGETAKFGGWSVDLTTNRVAWSDQVASIHGMPPGYSPLVGEGINFYAPEWRERITELFTACVKEGISYDEELEIITARGRRVWVRTTGEAVRDENDRIVKVQGSFQDISEKKESELAIQESERKLATLMANLPGMAYQCRLDQDWTMEFVSQGCVALTGYNPGELTGNNCITYEEITHPEDRDRIREIIIDSVKKGKPFVIEYRIIDAEGNIKWVWERGQAVPTDSNGEQVLEGFISDITIRKNAEAEVLALNDELEQRVKERTAAYEAVNRELEAFAYSVSHDLRAPLRAITGFSEYLEERYSSRLDDQAKHYLNRISSSAVYMGKLIEDMLKLSRVTRTELKRKQVNLSKFASDILASLREYEPDRSVETFIESHLTAKGDPHLLRLVLENLIGNSWKFSSREEKALIEIGSFQKDGSTVFFIRDNGVGFDMKYVNKLFGAFQRLHSAEEFPGTGIGLATVQRIINRHGGCLWAEGRIDEGAVFYFTLPGKP